MLEKNIRGFGSKLRAEKQEKIEQNSRDRRQKKMQSNPRKHLRDAEPQKCDDEIGKRERERVRAR